MVDTINSSFPVANISIPAKPSNGNSVEGGKTTPPSPTPVRTDQVNLSPEARIAARQVFSERPDINTSQEQSVQLSDPSDAVEEQAETFVSSQPATKADTSFATIGVSTNSPEPVSQPETVTVPPPDTSSFSGSGTTESESVDVEVVEDSNIGELIGVL